MLQELSLEHLRCRDIVKQQVEQNVEVLTVFVGLLPVVLEARSLEHVQLTRVALTDGLRLQARLLQCFQDAFRCHGYAPTGFQVPACTMRRIQL